METPVPVLSHPSPAAPTGRRITSKNVMPRPINSTLAASSQPDVENVQKEADVTTVSPVAPPQQPPTPMVQIPHQLSTNNKVNTVTWTVDTKKRVHAGSAETSSSGPIQDMVLLDGDEGIAIKHDGVYTIQVFGQDCDVSIMSRKAFMGRPVTSPFFLGKDKNFVTKTCSLKKGDVISLIAVPPETISYGHQPNININPNLRAREHIFQTVPVMVNDTKSYAVVMAITRIC